MNERTGRDSEPIRLFKSDILEFFSHVSPITVLVLWTPVAVLFLVLALVEIPQETFPYYLIIGLLLGWFVWTFAEYTMHRFIFHFHPKTEKLKRMFFMVHGVHHAQPLCRTRLVMPPAMSIPLAILFYGIFYLVVSVALGAPLWFYPVFTGFLGGYIVYDMLHYNLHHGKKKAGYLAMCRYQHMQHHGTCPNMRFGVTSPLWDYVFGTMPKPMKKAS